MDSNHATKEGGHVWSKRMSVLRQRGTHDRSTQPPAVQVCLEMVQSRFTYMPSYTVWVTIVDYLIRVSY